MKTPCIKNIENLDGIIAAFKQLYDSRKVTVQPVILTSTKLQNLWLDNTNDTQFLYGIFSVGTDSSLQLILPEDCRYDILPNNQIIELVNGITNVNGSNFFFRGYQLSVTE